MVLKSTLNMVVSDWHGVSMHQNYLRLIWMMYAKVIRAHNCIGRWPKTNRLDWCECVDILIIHIYIYIDIVQDLWRYFRCEVLGLRFLGFCPKFCALEIKCLLGLFASILLHGEWRNFALRWVPTMLLDHEPKKRSSQKRCIRDLAL